MQSYGDDVVAHVAPTRPAHKVIPRLQLTRRPAIASDGGWPGRSCIVCGTGRRSDAFHGARRLRRFREEGEARQVSAIATTSSGVGRALRLPITMGGGFSCRFVLSDLSDSTVASKIARSLASLRPCRLLVLLQGVEYHLGVCSCLRDAARIG